MSPWLDDEEKSSPSYHERVYAKNPPTFISPDDSILLSLEQSTRPRRGEVLVELGCGSGLRSLHLAREHSLVAVLMDFNRVATTLTRDNARRMGVECHVVRGDLKDIPMRDGVADIVWAEGTHEHTLVKQRKKIFDETRRIAKTGARAMILVPNVLNPLYRLEEFVKDRTEFAELYEIPFTRSELASWMSRSDFVVKGFEGQEVLYPLFSYSLFNLRDVPPNIKPLYKIKRWFTQTYHGGNGFAAKLLRLLRRLDREHFPRKLFGLEVGVVAQAVPRKTTKINAA